MSRFIGFSTGALAQSDFRRGLAMQDRQALEAVELSALRDAELQPLLAALSSLDVSSYHYVSFHAPSQLTSLSEADLVSHLKTLLPRRWPIIVHPDAITDFRLWEGFGEWLCIENMDKRKPIGRTVEELEQIFRELPQASFCFDIGHARQIDPTMSQAAFLLRAYGDRLKQLHVSEVNSRSKHEALNYTAVTAFRKVAHLVPPTTPLILETPITAEQMQAQVALARETFANTTHPSFQKLAVG
jgi:hypothetical protein